MRPSDQITVYSKPGCVQCDATRRELDKRKMPFSTVDITTNPDALAKVKAMGYRQAPVVVVGDGTDHWAGFRPDKIEALAPTGRRGVDSGPSRRHSISL